MPKILVSWTTLNGEKKRMAKLAKKLAIFTGLVQNIIEREAKNDPRNYTNRTGFYPPWPITLSGRFIRKPNSIIVLIFIQNISYLKKHLKYA